MAKQLAADRELALAIRPSLGFRFHRLWRFDADKSQFWDTVFAIIREEGVPGIAKLIGPSVAADEARELEDLNSLCEGLESTDEGLRRIAEYALNHLVGGLASPASEGSALVGPQAGPWCSLAERASKRLSERSVYALASLFSLLNEQSSAFTEEQREAAGIAARRMFDFAWILSRYDRWLVIRSIQSVCRTFLSDPGASRELLRRIIAPQRMSVHGFDELAWLAREAEGLISHDADFVAEIYRMAFSQPLPREEKTELFPSRILPLVSNRRQDFEHGLWQLAESFPAFLARAPKQATRALIAAIEAYVQQRHPLSSENVSARSFGFRGHSSRLRLDLSHVWDIGGIYMHDNAMRMLDAFSRHLNELGKMQTPPSELLEILDIVADENVTAVVWRRVLASAAQCPTTIGILVKELLWARPILEESDTTAEAGELLKVVFAGLPEEERRNIEKAILSVASEAPWERRQYAEHWRNRLLGCLDAEVLVTTEASEILSALRAEVAIPPNQPLVRFEPVEATEFSDVDLLRMKGVDVEQEPSLDLRNLEVPVRAFVQRYSRLDREVASPQGGA